MALSLVTAPAVEPLTLAQAKEHLRVDESIHDEDGLIEGLIVAAREYAETFTHRSLITQTWDLALDGFPCWSIGSQDREIDAGAIWLPKPPLISVTSVSYIDTAGVTQAWGASNYTVDAPAGPMARMGRVVPGWSIYYPVARYVPNAVTVRFVAGYGANGYAVPGSIVAAMKILIASWYDAGRMAIDVGLRAAAIEVPMTAHALLWPYKSF